ncbi:NAD(P)H-dependent glycerol-3-phosphate dehydrogenase [Synechocystis sp. LKSZ1]|uniref:NAD(P)H-dependent glycerol-3-phosphate dehydrogenase n=1 Tax=Synechocystis sp. LKSZ1 TaxID=3144951 RepID=UPI00336BF8C3
MADPKPNVTIIGAGRWGTALTNLVRASHHPVQSWSRHSPQPLADVIEGATILVSAVSMKGVWPTIQQLQLLGLDPSQIIVTATKGLDPIRRQTPSQLWQQAFPHNPLVVLSGPNLSKEIEAGLPTATAVASAQREAALAVQKVFASERLRVYINTDPLGTELGGTLKNVMAIAAGVCDGLGLGTNAKAALLTRALPEMIRVGTVLGAKAETFFGLSGLGDLLATCNSPLSRNYQVGYKLGQGKSLEQIIQESEGVAEGLNTTAVLMQIAQDRHLSLPITTQVAALLQGQLSPALAVQNLMARDLTAEFNPS